MKLIEPYTTTHDSIPAETGKNDGDRTSGDCISRQQAIEPEAISKWKKEFREYVDSLDIARDDWKGIIEYIDELPSVQPNHCAEVGKKVLIDRQEALEKIRTMQTYKLFAGDDMILVDKAQVQTELMMLPPAEPEQRWVPCSERLPEDFKKVLVFWWEHSEPMIDTAFWQKDAKHFDGQHWVRIEDKITHWMPLPEPYQGGEQE